MSVELWVIYRLPIWFLCKINWRVRLFYPKDDGTITCLHNSESRNVLKKVCSATQPYTNFFLFCSFYFLNRSSLPFLFYLCCTRCWIWMYCILEDQNATTYVGWLVHQFLANFIFYFLKIKISQFWNFSKPFVFHFVIFDSSTWFSIYHIYSPLLELLNNQ